MAAAKSAGARFLTSFNFIFEVVTTLSLSLLCDKMAGAFEKMSSFSDMLADGTLKVAGTSHACAALRCPRTPQRGVLPCISAYGAGLFAKIRVNAVTLWQSRQDSVKRPSRADNWSQAQSRLVKRSAENVVYSYESKSIDVISSVLHFDPARML
jgi:hypothetical protein